jgi:putative SOS response-associated peptidase YedK
MCNLYRHESTSAEIRNFAGGLGFDVHFTPQTSNLAPAYVGADQDGPVLRPSNGGLELAALRWGFPPAKASTKTPITNIRNLDSGWWRNVNGQYLFEPEYRCLVPFTRFSEWDAKARKNAWFDIDAELACFAGIWRPWRGERLMPVDGKSRRQRIETEIDLFAFLTTTPNEVVAPIHKKAMPVILTTVDECQTWLAGGEASLALQRPLADFKTHLIAE